MTNALKAFDPEKYTIESREAWNTVSQYYDENIANKFFKTLAQDLTSWAELKPGERVLDAACGAGIVTFQAAPQVAPQGNILGIDLSPAMIELCRKKAAARGLPNVDFRTHNAEHLTALDDQSFDAILSQLGLMLFAQPQAALQEFHRILKKTGRLVLSVQGRADKMIFTSIVQKTMARHAPWLKVEGAPTLYSFGEASVLEKALRDAGFSRIETKYINGSFDFPNFDQFWNLLIEGAGKTKSMLESLAPNLQQTIKNDVAQQAETYQSAGALNLPYELTAAKAFRS
ncbi:MAG: class I SAM-dependent methyltransferase [Elusimicrobia bacterium]|nr:class I SAM-dependent methyltransferase [Elusimicrobiota bacterium]